MKPDERDELDAQTLALIKCEGEIRKAVKKDFLRGLPQRQVIGNLRLIIEKRLKEVKVESLRDGARLSLWNFAYRQLAEWQAMDTEKVRVLLALMRIQDKRRKDIPASMTLTKARETLRNADAGSQYDSFLHYGEPLQKFHTEYIKKNVTPVLRRLEEQYPFDPDAFQGVGEKLRGAVRHNNSLRLKAELEVRYDHNQRMVRGLKQSNTKLVLCSSHADCSKRCRPWQGRVFSLDGSYGETEDGKPYVPLEVATDIFYTTRAGRVWKNGLLGFNCRHQLTPYKVGDDVPRASPKEEQRQYAITQRQRALERQVRRHRLEAQMLEDIGSPIQVERAKQKANKAYRRYIDFSKKNGRAYYPSRVTIL